MALLMGLAAALVWGVHDLVVRVLRPSGDALALLVVALAAGTAVLVPAALLVDGAALPPRAALAPAAAAGAAYAAGGLGLYRAFGIGPVRLAAPLCGSYPVLSLAFAVAEGGRVPPSDWLAVLAVIAGMALAASGAAQEGQGGSRAQAVAWALLASAGFAFTFFLAQGAAEAGGEVAATVALRLASLLCVALALLLLRASPAPALRQWRPLVLVGALDAAAIALVVAAAAFPRPELAAVASSTFGLVTILLAWRILREPMAPVQWAGAFLCFAGIAAVAA